MGIVTMVRMTKNMPRKLTESTLYSNSMHFADGGMKGQGYKPAEPAISASEFMAMMKRMASLEEKFITLSNQPPTMPPEKEEMLTNALTRIDALEQELAEAKKVYILTSHLIFFLFLWVTGNATTYQVNYIL